jgi:hypothetical protein
MKLKYIAINEVPNAISRTYNMDIINEFMDSGERAAVLEDLDVKDVEKKRCCINSAIKKLGLAGKVTTRVRGKNLYLIREEVK